MPTTPTYALPWPALTDPPNAPADMQKLATATETAIKGVESAFSYAEYAQTVAQTVTTSLDSRMLFNTAAVAPSNDVSHSATGVFTINRAGVYHVSGTMRWNAPGGPGGVERGAILSTTSATAYRFGGTNSYDPGPTAGPGVGLQLDFSGMRRFTAGETFAVWLWQAAGGDLATNVGLGPNRLQIARLGA